MQNQSLLQGAYWPSLLTQLQAMFTFRQAH